MVTKGVQQAFLDGTVTMEQRVQDLLGNIEKTNGTLNALLYVAVGDALDQARKLDQKKKSGAPLGALAGLTIAVKSCINVQGLPVTAASKVLEHYTGSYDADVIARIKSADGIIIGMTNMDEFACGASGEHSAFGVTNNPAAPGRIAGGSSSGSAASVAAGYCDLALGTDTGGSIRNPASHCGVVGIKPSYGRVSRHGLLDLSMSLDQIGALANDVDGAALLHTVLDGKSANDPSTIDASIGNYRDPPRHRLRVGIVKEFETICTDKRIWDAMLAHVKAFCEKTHSTVHVVSLPNVKLAVAAYYPLVYTEFFSATRRYDGRKYGKRFEDAAGEEALRRVLGGKLISRAEFDGQYYRKALGVKHAIAADFASAFEQCDVIVAPVTPVLPHMIGDEVSAEVEYGYDAFTIPANFAGICAGVVPCTKIDEVPVGVQVMAPAFMEERMFSALKEFEKLRK
jgi:aspartyl-tRNA(Asn)/glutamyl-tRNA(Gln) amidotransferase subunit A